MDVFVNKNLRRSSRKRPVKGLHDQNIEPDGFEEFHLLIEIDKEFRATVRLEDLPRMGIERVENGLTAQGTGSPDHHIQDGSMAEVKPIKIANRQNRAVELSPQFGGPVYQLQC